MALLMSSSHKAGFMKKHELLNKGLFTIFILVVFTLGKNIFLPGVDPTQFENSYETSFSSYVLSLVTGGNLSLPTIFALGIGPYMTSLMIWQLLPLIDKDINKRMSEKRRGTYQKILTLFFACFQGFFTFQTMTAQFPTTGNILTWRIQIVNVFVLIAGAMFITWLADMNVRKGLGGATILIVPGLLFSLPSILHNFGGQKIHFSLLSGVLGWIIVLVLAWVGVFLNHSELRINVQRTGLDNDFANSYIPIKAIPAGSMPLMFALTIFTIPQYLLMAKLQYSSPSILTKFLSFESWQGVLIYAILMILLGICFAYVNVRPSDIAKDLKESGDYVLGYLLGDATEQMLNKHLLFMTAIGNIFFVCITVIPLVVGLWVPMVRPLSFLMSSVIILVTIIDTFIEEVRTIWERRHYSIFKL